MVPYFEKPTQVMWYDVDGDEYKAGIAYCDEIICACCGGVISIEEIYEFTPNDIIPIYQASWVDLSDEICPSLDEFKQCGKSFPKELPQQLSIFDVVE